MKNFQLKSLMNLSWFFVLALVIATSSCKKDDPTPPAVIEDGVYVKGLGTALTDYDAKGLMKVARNEVTQADRSKLMELYVAIKAGADGFNLVVVTGGTPKVYGPGADFAVVAAPTQDEPSGAAFSRGSYVESATPFTVSEDGLYHVVIDTELNIIVIARVKWGIIGGATPNGWGGSTALPSTGFDLNKMTFELADVILVAGDYKFRYSDGWKIEIDPNFDLGDGNTGVKVNTNFGGTAFTSLVAGGANITNADPGVYTISITWESGVGTTANLVKTADYTPPAYPAEMFIVGDATAYGWDTPGTKDAAAMHKAAGGSPTEGIFWKICYIETGKGFKVSAENWGTPNIGFAEVDEFDANGETVSDNGGNMSVATSGMYMVVLNLQDSKQKISVTPAKVYGMGDAFGGWTEDVAANLFTIDNTAKTITSPALSADGNIRMYVDHAWIPDWWNAEFNVYSGVIEYRNDGGDQAAAAGTTGQVITLTFDDNTATVQ